MTVDELYVPLCWVQIAFAVPTLGWLLFMSAPYGRHLRKGWGPTIPARLGWILMESPAVAWFSLWYWLGDDAASSVPLLLFALWQIHYVHRTLIYPFRLRSTGRRMPVLVAGLAFVFQLLNGFINGVALSHLEALGSDALTAPHFLIGVGLFVVGLAINLHSDTVLLNLRKPGETGYKIPKGGLFRYVTSPNYFGEMLEWIGWAIATWSLAGVAFAVYTIANLAPRALSNHTWYLEKFPDYPKERRKLVPFLF